MGRKLIVDYGNTAPRSRINNRITGMMIDVTAISYYKNKWGFFTTRKAVAREMMKVVSSIEREILDDILLDSKTVVDVLSWWQFAGRPTVNCYPFFFFFNERLPHCMTIKYNARRQIIYIPANMQYTPERQRSYLNRRTRAFVHPDDETLRLLRPRFPIPRQRPLFFPVLIRAQSRG